MTNFITIENLSYPIYLNRYHHFMIIVQVINAIVSLVVDLIVGTSFIIIIIVSIVVVYYVGC